MRPADVDNAQAAIDGYDRLILYRPGFVRELELAAGKAAPYFILAHEIGHHVLGHTLQRSSSPELELEADEFAGHALGSLGIGLDEARKTLQLFQDERESEAYPSREARLRAVQRGWEQAVQGLRQATRVRELEAEGRKRVAYIDLLRAFETLLEPFSALADQSLGGERPGAEPEFDARESVTGRNEKSAEDDFRWLLQTVRIVQTSEFLTALGRHSAADVYNDGLHQIAWATYFSEHAETFKEQTTAAIQKYSLLYDSETLAALSELDRNLLTKRLLSLAVRTEDENQGWNTATTLKSGLLGEDSERQYYLPYFRALGKCLAGAATHVPVNDGVLVSPN